MSILIAAGVAGCGAHSSVKEARQATSQRGCTDTWTGRAGDNEYTDPGNWSAGRVPGNGDFACIPPGSWVAVDQAPVERATSLLIEGTVCMQGNDVFQLAVSTINGTPPGEPALPSLRGGPTGEPQCPAGTGVSMGGLTQAAPWLNSPEPQSRTAPIGPTVSGGPVA